MISRYYSIDFQTSIRTSRSVKSDQQRTLVARSTQVIIPGQAVFSDSISTSECLCILTYDAMSLISGCLWGYAVLGTFALLFQGLASLHALVYVCCTFIYFLFFVLAMGRMCLIW